MISVHQLVATVFGIGYMGKGGGTVAAIVYCLIWFFAAGDLQGHWQLFIASVVIAAGIWSGNEVDERWGKDSNKVVIDEVAGMMITLLFIPVSVTYALTGLVLFRFFDILKPLLIKRMENLPGGWGVMGDDVLAGIYAQLVLQLIIALKIY